MPFRWRDSWLLIPIIVLAGLFMLPAMAAPAPNEIGKELLANPGFETSLAPWAIEGNTTQAMHVCNHGYSTACSAQITSSSSGWAGLSQLVTVEAQAVYTAQAYFVLLSPNQNAQLHITWYSASNAEISSEMSQPASDLQADSWVKREAIVTALPEAVRAKVQAVVNSGVGTYFYLDDVSFVQTALPPSFTPTSSPSRTPPITSTPTRTSTPSLTPQPSPTRTRTAVSSFTATPTATPTHDASPGSTETATPTLSGPLTPSATPTETPAEVGGTPSATATAAAADDTPTATATVTVTPTATATPNPSVLFLPVIVMQPAAATPTTTAETGAIHLNEILPAPGIIDWNGDGEVNSEDEWVELFNSATFPVDVSGWALDDEADAGSRFYFLPAGTVIPPYGFLVLYGSETGINFADTKDVVRLLYRDGSLLDEFRYFATWHDRSFSVMEDRSGWTIWYAPSPGRPNHP